MKNIDIKLLEKYGLLAEFAYITLESDFYKQIKKTTHNEKLEKYFDASEKDIEKVEGEDRNVIAKKTSFSDYFKEKYDDIYAYKGTKNKARQDVLEGLLSKYDVIDFTSDNKHWYDSDFQAMLLKEK